MIPEDMTVGELEVELDQLMHEKAELEKNWMVDDPDDEWGQVNREIKRVEELLRNKRSV